MTRLLLLLVAAGVLGALPARANDEAGGAADPQPVLMAPMGHSQMVLSAVFSPNGRYVLTGADDTTAQLWETATGREVRRFEGHEKGVYAVAFSPDGTQVLTGSADGTARLWEVATGREVHRLEGHAGAVRAASFLPDGLFVVTGSDDTSVRLWETASGQERARWDGHTDGVLAVAVSPDGGQVLTSSSDRTVRLWETATGKELRRFEGHVNPVRSLAFSPDGALFLTGYWDLTPRLWETGTGREVRELVGETMGMGSPSVAFAPDGTHVLTGSRDGSARLWATATGRQVRSFKGHEGDVYAVAFSPDGTHVLTGAYDRTARLWETATGAEIRRFEGQVRSVSTARFSPDGVYIVRGSGDGTAGLWDTTDGREARTFTGHSRGVTSVAVSPDGHFVLTGSFDHTARLWDRVTGGEIRRFEGHTGAVTSAVFSSAGTHVLTGSADKTARVWEAATGDEIRRFVGHGGSVTSVAFSPDDRSVLTGSDDKTARLWETATGRQIRPLSGHTGWVAAVAFSPDGGLLLTGSWDKTARLWQAATGREVRRLEGHTKGVVSVGFSPDGAQAVTGSWDRTAWVWDAAMGRVVRRLEGHTGEVTSASFSPDGRHLVTAATDATIRLWDAAAGGELCSLRSFTEGSWAVIDEQGRYDACKGGDVPGLHWVVGMEVIALDQLKDRYYEPGLLAKHLGRNPDPLREIAAFTQPKLYPDVRVEQAGGTIQVQVDDQGGGIGRVVIMVNGKERTADARGEGADAGAGTLTLSEDLADDPRLLPGEENRIEVFAYNEEGYLRSRGVTVAYVPEGEKHEPSLWAVVAGVSDYEGEKLDLRFAAKDAEDFAASVTMAGEAFFGEANTHVTLLTDAAARQEDLKEALQGMCQAKAGDVLLIYLAGHGVGYGDSFYYLTADAATDDLSDDAIRDSTSLCSTEMIDLINRIPALKQVLILDTCSSGSFIDELTGAGESRKSRGSSARHVRALERVKDRTGTFVLAGCASDMVSYEAPQFGQGLLTYSLLLGMKGGSLHDKELVDVSTLFNFAADRVPELARRVGGVQRPVMASPRGGNSFYIGLLSEKHLAAIPLQAERPLFVRSSLLDQTEGADVLELGHHVDDALAEEAVRDRAAPLGFLPAGRMHGAFRISGMYTTQDGTTTVRFKLWRDKEAVTEGIEVVGTAAELPARVVEAATRSLTALDR